MSGRRFGIAAGILVTAAAGLVASRYRRRMRAARRRISSRSRIASTSSGTIEYADAGDGPPVLVVHGAGGGFDQGLELGSALASRGFHVIAMSRFGYLRTPLPADASAMAQADAHVALMDALGIEKAAVVGFSAGSPSSMQLAIRHPDRVSALVLVVPAAFAPRPGEAASKITPPAVPAIIQTALNSDFLFWTARHAAPRVLVRTILGTPPEDLSIVDPSERDRVMRLLDEILPVSSRRLGLLNDEAVVSKLERYDLESISAPTLLVSVADDQYGTFDGARYSAEFIPDAKFIGFATGGHMCAGHQDDLDREITQFLTQALEQRDLPVTASTDRLVPVAPPTMPQPAALTSPQF